MKSSKAFTLIELLIVVAIIAILAAIAVPNFLEAQTRAKVTRAKSDMRAAATALEAYHIDYNQYPFDGYNRADTARYNYWFLPIDLSTPIAYLTSAKLVDPFRDQKPGPGRHWQFDDMRYRNTEATWGTAFAPFRTDNPTAPAGGWRMIMEDMGGWSLVCVGPDRIYGPNASSNQNTFPGAVSWRTSSGYSDHVLPYDPTNGTTSWGDIIRSQVSPSGYVNTP